jgi:uncharacterized membrane protein YfcA
MLIWILTYMALGGGIGVLAGLFGIGGGGVMVPVLTGLFAAQAFPDDHLIHLALGTSMAAIVPTALSSMLAHNRRGAVLWSVVYRLAPGVILGTFAATFLAAKLSAKPLAVFFATFMGYVAYHMISNHEPRASRNLPSAPVLAGVGTGIGAVSAMVAIGGGSLTVPFLGWCNVRMQTAIGTSAAVGLPIAFMGAFGYALNGLNMPGLPAGTVGYIYWPAALAIAAASSLTAPLGARLAHRLPVATLKRLFALLLIALSLHMLYHVFT